jgi:hypothetical protein
MTIPTFPGGGGSGGGTGGDSSGGSSGSGDVMSNLLTSRRKRTATQERADVANVPSSGAGRSVATVSSDPRRKRRQRDTVLTGATGTGEDVNIYRPSLVGY